MKMNRIFRLFRSPSATSAVACLALAWSCVRYDAPQPLDSWSSEGRALRTSTPTVAAGQTLTAAGDYKNFRLTGQAMTQEGAEAALLLHTDGESGYEVILRNGPIAGTRKSG